VIDAVRNGKEHSGWINCDRLIWLFVPKYLHPEKLPLDDGDERLVRYFGQSSNEFSSSPITLVADAYDRFGVMGVFGSHLFFGFCLIALGRLVLLFRHPLLVIILVACFARLSLRLYPQSVLGFFQATFYAFGRDTIIICVMFLVSSLCLKWLKATRLKGTGWNSLYQ